MTKAAAAEAEMDIICDWACSAPRSLEHPRAMNTLDELVRLWGVEDGGNSFSVPEQAVRDVLEFSLSASERQVCVVHDRPGLPLPWRSRKIRLLGKDVNEGAMVVRLLGKEVHQDTQLQIIKCLADLAKTSQNQVKIVSYPGVLDAVIRHLRRDGGPLVQEHAARCLVNLAETEENHVKMASSIVLDGLVKLLGFDEAPALVHEQVARCLTNLAVSNENKERIANYPGLLSALAAQLQKNGCSSLHRQITECLTNLASSQKVQVKIVTDYSVVLDCLVRFLRENGTSDVQLQSLKCLTALSDHYQRNQVDIASHTGVLDALLRLLRHNWITTDRMKVQLEAAKCLLKLLSAPENLLKIGCHDGAFEVLDRCLDKLRIREVQNSAAECFRLLAAAPENQMKIVSFRGGKIVSALVNLLAQFENSTTGKVENPTGQELAAWCLSALANAKETKVTLTFYPGLLRSIVSVLTKSNGDVLEPAMKCLLNLSQVDQLRARVRITSYHGLIDALVRMLGRNWNVSVIEHTANCLPNLVLTPENTGVIDSLVKLLRDERDDKDVDSLENTARCLSYLAQAPQNAKEIVSHPNVLVSLVNLLQLDANAGVLEHTAKCLTNLACTQESQVKMASFPGMLNALVLSLSVRNELFMPHRGSELFMPHRVQEQVVKCLAKLSEPPANQSKIASYPGVSDALRRLANDDAHPMAQKEAGLCLDNLNISAIADRDGRPDSPGQSTDLQRRRLQSGDAGGDDWFEDPITCETMCDPVKCNDGVTYDRWTIINNGIHRSPFNPSVAKFCIAFDDIDVRRRLFHTFPEQEAKFRRLRESYREKALQNARALEFQDAIEKLNNVIVWAPSDTQCRTELQKILNLLDEQSPSVDRQIQENPELYYADPRQIERDSDRDRLLDIPVLFHEDVMRAREEEGRRALWTVIIVFSLYFAVFLFP